MRALPRIAEEPDPWTTVFTGPMSEVLVIQGLLESNGIPIHVLDGNLSVIDPFLKGSNAFDVQIQTPESFAKEAREIVGWRPSGSETDAERPDPAVSRAEKIGNRIRWASITMVTAPYALCLAPSYFRAIRDLRIKPRNHLWTMAALVFSAALTMILISYGIRGRSHESR
jgi:hypothetical protein